MKTNDGTRRFNPYREPGYLMGHAVAFGLLITATPLAYIGRHLLLQAHHRWSIVCLVIAVFLSFLIVIFIPRRIWIDLLRPHLEDRRRERTRKPDSS